jgi:serine/threonine protein kinase
MVLMEAIDITLAICGTLQVAHGRPVIHRDLKPDNVMLSDSSPAKVVVIDFGLSFNADEADQQITQTDDTFRNKFLDLPENNVPDSDRRDPRSDITAACALLLYCLTGQRIGHLQDSNGIGPHRRKGTAINELLPNEPRLPFLLALFDRGLALNINDRFQAVEELIRELTRLKSDQLFVEVESPTQVAARLRRQLQQNDRGTQLAGFIVHANWLITEINKAVGRHSKELDPFKCQIQALGQDLPVPDGYERVKSTTMILHVWHKLHAKNIKSVIYQVFARGSECTLFRADTNQKSPVTFQLPTDLSWGSVLPYVANIQPDSKFAIRDVEAWMNRTMEQLAKEITNAPQQ